MKHISAKIVSLNSLEQPKESISKQ